MEPKKKDKKSIILDTDHRWFNNPQYRIKVTRKTRLVISLMQKDNRAIKGSNIYKMCDFMLVKAKQKSNRVWVMPPESDIVTRAYDTTEEPE